MKKISVIVLFLMFETIVAIAQGFIYKSEVEEQLFARLDSSDVPLEDLFLILSENNSNSTLATKKINAFYEEIKKLGIEKKSERQKVKLLFNAIHKKFFTLYSDEAFFEDIFTNGKFNCVTATALYSIVLEKYQIPYTIKEMPTHVFVVAYPNVYNIMMESTNPKGFFAPSDVEKDKYLKSLIEMKMLTEQEVRQKGSARAFNDFFFPNDNITARQLAGLQYYNLVVKNIKAKNSLEAYKAVKKAELLYPCNKMKYTKTVLLAELINNSDFSNEDDISFLTEYVNVANDEKAKRFFLGTFENLANKTLVKQSNSEKFTSYYYKILTELNCEEIKNEIKEIYFSQLGGWHASSNRFTEAIGLAKEGYSLNPLNSHFQNIISFCIVKRHSSAIGNLSILDSLDSFEMQYPFLKEDNSFRSLKFHHTVYLAYKYFNADQEKEGNKLLSIIEKDFTDYKELNHDNMMLGMVYAEAGAHYFRKRNYSKAKVTIERGFAFAPDHPELKVRMEIVLDEMKKPK